jgi:hypothetical protein
MNAWKFKDPPNTAVISNKRIVNNNYAITYVFHDKADGGWQFLDSSETSAQDALIVSLQNIVTLDDTVTELVDLPLGWHAWRKDKSGSWERAESV